MCKKLLIRPSHSGANIYPEVTYPFCRLPLFTLLCWTEALNLGDLLRLLIRSYQPANE